MKEPQDKRESQEFDWLEDRTVAIGSNRTPTNGDVVVEGAEKESDTDTGSLSESNTVIKKTTTSESDKKPLEPKAEDVKSNVAKRVEQVFVTLQPDNEKKTEKQKDEKQKGEKRKSKTTTLSRIFPVRHKSHQVTKGDVEHPNGAEEKEEKSKKSKKEKESLHLSMETPKKVKKEEKVKTPKSPRNTKEENHSNGHSEKKEKKQLKGDESEDKQPKKKSEKSRHFAKSLSGKLRKMIPGRESDGGKEVLEADTKFFNDLEEHLIHSLEKVNLKDPQEVLEKLLPAVAHFYTVRNPAEFPEFTNAILTHRAGVIQCVTDFVEARSFNDLASQGAEEVIRGNDETRGLIGALKENVSILPEAIGGLVAIKTRTDSYYLISALQEIDPILLTIPVQVSIVIEELKRKEQYEKKIPGMDELSPEVADSIARTLSLTKKGKPQIPVDKFVDELGALAIKRLTELHLLLSSSPIGMAYTRQQKVEATLDGEENGLDTTAEFISQAQIVNNKRLEALKESLRSKRSDLCARVLGVGADFIIPQEREVSQEEEKGKGKGKEVDRSEKLGGEDLPPLKKPLPPVPGVEQKPKRPTSPPPSFVPPMPPSAVSLPKDAASKVEEKEEGAAPTPTSPRKKEDSKSKSFFGRLRHKGSGRNKGDTDLSKVVVGRPDTEGKNFGDGVEGESNGVEKYIAGASSSHPSKEGEKEGSFSTGWTNSVKKPSPTHKEGFLNRDTEENTGKGV